MNNRIFKIQRFNLVKSTLVNTIIILLFVLCACKKPWDHSWVAEMKINDVDLEKFDDGTYRGSFSYNRFTYIVESTVNEHKYSEITIIQNRTTERAVMAEEVVGRVKEHQTLLVDAVSGATASSKALLKAIENGFK